MIPSTVAGIPCLIQVDTCLVVEGSPYADNDWDYYGYNTVEFSVLDRKGYPAKWLERKLTDADVSRITTEILEYQDDDY